MYFDQRSKDAIKISPLLSQKATQYLSTTHFQLIWYVIFIIYQILVYPYVCFGAVFLLFHPCVSIAALYGFNQFSHSLGINGELVPGVPINISIYIMLKTLI